jgi:hypothetical protein
VPAAGLAALLVGHPRGPPCPVGRAPEAHPTDPGHGAPAFLGGCPSRLPGLAAGGAPAAPRSPGARLLVGSSGRPSFAARRLPWAAAALVAKPLGEAAPDGGPAHGLRQLVVLLPGGFPPLPSLGFLPRLAEDVPRPLPQGLASPLCRDLFLIASKLGV